MTLSFRDLRVVLEHECRVGDRRAARGHEARREPAERQQCDDRDVDGWIEHRGPEQQTAHQTGHTPATNRTEQQSDADRTEAAGDDKTRDLGGGGTEREANADFVTSLPNRERGHAVY